MQLRCRKVRAETVDAKIPQPLITNPTEFARERAAARPNDASECAEIAEIVSLFAESCKNGGPESMDFIKSIGFY